MTDPSAPAEDTRGGLTRSAVLRFAALVGGLATLAVAVATGAAPDPAVVRELAAGAGPLGPLVVVAVAAALMAALVPRTLLAAASGALFGVAEGAVYVLLAALLGAVVAFAIGRGLGRDVVRARGARLDALARRHGVLGVVVLRLLPVAPFGLVSYAFGATGVRVRAFVLGTALGAAPGTVLWATVGATALDPASPAFVASAVAAAGLAAAGAAGARLSSRRAAPRRRAARPPG